MNSRSAVLWLSVWFSVTGAAGAQSTADSKRAEAVYYADAYADHYELPRALIHAIISQESAWNQFAISDKGALGLMQLMPGTAENFGVVDRTSIADNIGGGVRYLAELNRMFSGDLRLVVAAYYCGERTVRRRGLGYDNPDVVRYVRSVERRYWHELQLQQTVPPKGD